MTKVLNCILIIIYFSISMIAKSNASDISTILKNQQLTVFDIGIFEMSKHI